MEGSDTESVVSLPSNSLPDLVTDSDEGRDPTWRAAGLVDELDEDSERQAGQHVEGQPRRAAGGDDEPDEEQPGQSESECDLPLALTMSATRCGEICPKW